MTGSETEKGEGWGGGGAEKTTTYGLNHTWIGGLDGRFVWYPVGYKIQPAICDVVLDDICHLNNEVEIIKRIN